MDKPFWEAVKGRRSIYALSAEPVVGEQRIEQILADALANVPSPFNSQSTRLLLLLGAHHQKLWQLTLEALRGITSPATFKKSEQKICGAFASGYGTVLFFEDLSVTRALSERFTDFAAYFPVWGQHSNAMHQFVIWTALEAEGLGASLQHYNPLIDDDVRAAWDVPYSWQLVAQMPFGKPEMSPEPKEVSAISARLKVFRQRADNHRI